MRFLYKQFDDEAVLYDTASGDTHLLDAFSWQVLQVCQRLHTTDPARLKPELDAFEFTDEALAERLAVLSARELIESN